MLESRLDNIAFKMGFGASRSEARQIVRHNAILVNGKRVNIPSYQLRPGDVVEVAAKAKEHLRIKRRLRPLPAAVIRNGSKSISRAQRHVQEPAPTHRFAFHHQ